MCVNQPRRDDRTPYYLVAMRTGSQAPASRTDQASQRTIWNSPWTHACTPTPRWTVDHARTVHRLHAPAKSFPQRTVAQPTTARIVLHSSVGHGHIEQLRISRSSFWMSEAARLTCKEAARRPNTAVMQQHQLGKEVRPVISAPAGTARQQQEEHGGCGTHVSALIDADG